MADTCTVHVYKDGWLPSRLWNADVRWDDGKVWKSWCSGYKTKKSLIEHINAVDSPAVRAITY